ncbi:hypothetical protein WBG78_07590 [Chryseolinea sp. T2]|uniref:hypothetical protein n=1 Tax=Chryseolinea sp. T2 TaxID=3129255 RepID=UPI0030788125
MKHYVISLIILLLVNCKPSDRFDYDIIVSEIPTNIYAMNSEYDDYNSDLGYPSEGPDFYFSSNRNSAGKDYDIVSGALAFSYHRTDRVLNLAVPRPADVGEAAGSPVLEVINSPNDEFGPYSYVLDQDLLFFYATNPGDTFDIKFVQLANWRNVNQTVSEPYSLTRINSVGDNLYPSIDTEHNRIYFCSNRGDTSFNIYTARYSAKITMDALVNDRILDIKKEAGLSSFYDEKCPFVKDNFMVFTSNRDGDYDLWYSKFENETWSPPSKIR